MITYSKRDELSQEFALEITRHLKLEKIYLFGSTAKKKDRINSDIDICFIGKSDKLGNREKEIISNQVTEFLIEHAIVINWIYFNRNQWEKETIPITKTIKNEGKILWEKEKTESHSQKISC